MDWIGFGPVANAERDEENDGEGEEVDVVETFRQAGDGDSPFLGGGDSNGGS